MVILSWLSLDSSGQIPGPLLEHQLQGEGHQQQGPGPHHRHQDHLHHSCHDRHVDGP